MSSFLIIQFISQIMCFSSHSELLNNRYCFSLNLFNPGTIHSIQWASNKYLFWIKEYNHMSFITINKGQWSNFFTDKSQVTWKLVLENYYKFLIELKLIWGLTSILLPIILYAFSLYSIMQDEYPLYLGKCWILELCCFVLILEYLHRLPTLTSLIQKSKILDLGFSD